MLTDWAETKQGASASSAEIRPANTPDPRRMRDFLQQLRLGRLLRLGIRQKVVLVLLTALLVALTANTWLTLRSQEREVLDEANRRGQELSYFIAQNLAHSVVGYNYHAIELLLAELVKNADIAYARVLSARGNSMAQAGRDGVQADIVQFRQPIRLGADTVGELHMGLSTQRIVANLERARHDSILRQVIITLLVLLVEFAALSWLILRPVHVISNALHGDDAAPAASLPRAIPLQSSDEFGEVASRFNRLHQELHEAHRQLHSRIDLANGELQQANALLTSRADELKRVNQELEQLTVTDSLTGLHNRRHFEQLMENEVAQSIRSDETISIILIDIDHFKQFNERYGYRVGDEIVRNVAHTISERIRRTDVACRFGGDEFFILCRRATIASALTIADELHDAVTGQPMQVAGQSVAVTVSMGVATLPSTETIDTAEQFFKCADIALHFGKRHGRNHVAHYSMLDKIKRAQIL